jgi:hypothetical protein
MTGLPSKAVTDSVRLYTDSLTFEQINQLAEIVETNADPRKLPWFSSVSVLFQEVIEGHPAADHTIKSAIIFLAASHP